ncbi:MAG: baseplate J/gp47 family protein [Anaeromicrobium sp.]|uniref:baseplate J/gp47 family protein n=1 Tax=Anaeromicrobium sp. TaxID=1929132 RepID=UPI0025DB00E7|nr:baseplate J/gp47 family protein [Anaeromicrobium sp.]MCT4593191.1 baseplate J/gp47 family protein [Anaeromicrobium sp.]
MEKDLPMPGFLEEDADIIHKRMLEKAPPGISTIEGDFFWDNTRPTAEEKAELIQLKLQNILRLAFPQTSYGLWLEYLGECKGVFKNPATKSTGVIKVKGKFGTVVEKGKIVGIPATDKKESIEFEFTETEAIDDTGIAYINAKCLQEGTVGNVLPNTITVLITPINGIKSITNEEEFKGGTEIEDEEHYRDRVIEEEQDEDSSGNDEDYVKWAKQVPGVGFAYVISEWDGAGTVKVLILDKNGQPAVPELIGEVQKYIAPIVPKGQNRGGKAPIGAIVTVTAPSVLNIDIRAHFEFEDGFNTEEVLNNLKDKVNAYLGGIDVGGTIIYKVIDTIAGSMILQKEGLKDFNNLTINNGTINIELIDQVATVGEVNSI